MKNFVIRMYKGLFNVIYTSVFFFLCVWAITEVDSLSGFEAGITLIIAIIGIILSLVMCYLVGMWEQGYKEQEREKKSKLSKINHDSLCETETFKVGGTE